MEVIIQKLLFSRIFIRIAFFIFAFWLFTGSDIMARMLAIILIFYSIISFTNPERLTEGISHYGFKNFMQNYGGYLLVLLSIPLLLNIHTQTSVTEGILIIIFVLAMIPLAVSDSLYKSRENLIRNKIIALIFLAVFGFTGIMIIIDPEPASLDFIEVLILGGLIMDIFTKEKDER